MTTVLVVDDSALMRKLLRRFLDEHGGFEVLTARNGVDALEQIRRHEPDVVTLDINMPEMDGLTCLEHIMAEAPRPVVMVSSLTARGAVVTLEALELGAVDYVAKPGGTVSLNLDLVAEEFLAKVVAAAGARTRRALGLRRRLASRDRPSPRGAGSGLEAAPRPAGILPRLVLVGASTGGPGILPGLLAPLPARFGAPIVIAQHIPGTFSGPLADRLDGICRLRVVEAGHAVPLEPGTVVVGRGDADVSIARRGGALVARSVPSDPSLRWHPSVERLVRSALDHLDPTEIVGVQLTGMGDDGAEAMAAVHRGGGGTIAESEDSAVVWGMPGELVRRGGATRVLPADRIAGQLIRWVEG
jgi:two-component system chemotaxis response regulator CheB